MKLNYKKMVEEIDKLVETDFAENMSLKQMPNSKPYTQEEALEMAGIIGSVYSVVHCIHCRACQVKYVQARR